MNKPRTRRFVVFGILPALWTLLPAAAAAQDESGKRLPALGGHDFVVSAEVADPFITSFLRSATGGGVAFNIRTPVLDARSDTVVVEGDLAFLELGLEGQGALADWVALRLGFDGGARVGTSVDALRGSGVSAVYGYVVGARFRLLETRKVFLSATADFTGNKIYDVSVLTLLLEATELVNTGKEPIQSGTDKALEGGLGFAWAASRLIGVRASGAIGFAEPFREEVDSKMSYFGGAAVGFNLANTSSVPIGLLGFIKLANFSAGSSDLVGGSLRTGLEIDYTGQPDFSTGLTLAYNRFETALTGQAISTFDALINIRYFF